MNKFKVGDDVVLIDTTGLLEKDELKGSVFKYEMDFHNGVKWGHISNDFVNITAPWVALQLKSEYDMENSQSKKEVKRIPFDLERAKNGDIIILDGDTGRYMLTNKNAGETMHIFQLEVNKCHDQAIVSFHQESQTWFHGFLGKKCECSVFMAPVEKKGWIAIFKGPNIDNRLAMTTNAYSSEGEAIDAASRFYDYESLICTKEISWTE